LRNNFKLLKDEKGSALVIYALCFSIFLGISATVLDGGLLYVTRSNLSNAVDSAALAGAQELPYNPAGAMEMAKAYGLSNGLLLEEMIVEVSEDHTSIRVEAEKDVEFFFAKFIGFDSGRVNRSAVASVAPIVGVSGAVPLGIEEAIFEIGKEYNLKVGAGESTTGWFGALALSKPGASYYEDNLTFGFDGIIRIGDILDIQTGNISNPTQRAIDYRIENSGGTYTSTGELNRNSLRLLKVPVIEFVGHNQVKVIAFSMFLVDQVMGQGTESYITGKFVRTVTSGELDFNASDFGLYGVKLSR